MKEPAPVLEEIQGTILWGVNNIWTVLAEGREYRCRIKGKVLKGREETYSPLVPGDRVRLSPVSNLGEGLILERLDRRNSFCRLNSKRGLVQILAANIDILVCLCSPLSPPFRPRFIDRVLVMAEGHFPVLIVCNKGDQLPPPGPSESPSPEDCRRRLADFERMGYPVLFCSALHGEGMDRLREALAGKTAALVGQSGVGKSSLLNSLTGFHLTTGAVSEKHNRGRHTTNFARLFPWEGGGLVDTPGIREIGLWGFPRRDLAHFMRDLKPFLGSCALPGCLHQGEPGCAVRGAAEQGKIHFDRYDSYLRMLGDGE
ncbi:MAG: ribosome small subunit-dependent GTPase A [Spirochaetales bacterium]|jgi:ribosome biogenesis GTPase|nr:ribosome small subunit-dependent GTPase A [Spirochaetales bacterium]